MLSLLFQTPPFVYGSGQTTRSVFGIYTLPQDNPDNESTPSTTVDGETIVGEVSEDYLFLVIAMNDPNGGPAYYSLQAYEYDASVGNLLNQQNYVPGVFFNAKSIFLSATGVGYFAYPSNLSSFNSSDLSSQQTVMFNASLYGISSFSAFIQVDESADVLLVASTQYLNQLEIYNLVSGQFSYSLNMPGNIVGLAMLGDGLHAYVLCDNCTLLLIDYTTGNVLKAFYFPPSTGANSWAGISVYLYWYQTYSQLFVCEITADVDGQNTSRVLGYKMMDTPNRLLNPIPLSPPVAGQTIQVLTQLLNDLNMGVGGSLIYSTVSGSGTAATQSMTDICGRAYTKVLCTETGSVDVISTCTIPDIVAGLTPPYTVPTAAQVTNLESSSD